MADPDDNVLPGPWTVEAAQRAAAARITLGMDGSPDDAARAAQLSDATGAAPDYINDDVKAFESLHKASLANSLVVRSPALTGYINSHPLSAQISNNDWGPMAKADASMRRMVGDRYDIPEALNSSIGAGIAQFKKTWDEDRPADDPYTAVSGMGSWITGRPAAETWEKENPQLASSFKYIANNPVVQFMYHWNAATHLGQAFSATIEGAGAALQNFLVKAGVSQSAANLAINTAQQMAEWGAIRGDIAEPEGAVHAIADRLVKQARDARVAEAMELARPYLEAGREPPKGLHPLIDQLKAIQALLDEEAGDTALKDVQKTETFGIAPDFSREHFLSQYPDTQIEINGEAARGLYGDKVPEPDDGILGWVKNIKEQLAETANNGGNILVSRADWIRHAAPDVYQALKDDIAWRHGGMTVKEAKEALKEKPEEEAGANDNIPGAQPTPSALSPEELNARMEKVLTDQPELRQVPAGVEADFIKNLSYSDYVKYMEEGGLKPTIVGEEGPHRITDEELKERTRQEPMTFAQKVINGIRRAVSLEWRPIDIGDQRQMRFLPPPEKLVASKWKNTDPTSPMYDKEHSVIHTMKGEDLLPRLNHRYLIGVAKALNQFFGKQIEPFIKGMPVHIVSREVMDEIEGVKKGEPHSSTAGFYHHGQVVLREDVVNGTQRSWWSQWIIQHEFAHAATINALASRPELKAQVRELMDHADKWMKANRPEFRKKHDYAFKNELEFVAEFMSKYSLQRDLSEVPLAKGMAEKFGVNQGSSVWHGIKETIKKLMFEAFGKMPSNSVMDAMLRVTERTLKTQSETEWVYGKLGEVSHYPKAPGYVITERAPMLDTEISPEEQKLFEQGKALGMSKKHYEALLKLVGEQQAGDLKAAQDHMKRMEALRLTKEWKENLKGVNDEVREAIIHRPDVGADLFLRTGNLFGQKYRRTRLNGEKLTDAQREGLDPEYYNEAQGHEPEAIANLLGFNSADQMTDALKSLGIQREAEGLTHDQHLEHMIDQLTEREMRKRYGPLEEQILAEMEEHVFNETQFSIVHEDTLRLAEEAGIETPLTKEDIKEMALNDMRTMSMKKIKARQMMEQVGKLGRQIEKFEAQGDWVEAYKLAQKREVAFQQAREAIKAEKMVGRFDRRAKQFQPRESKTSIPVEYINFIQRILKQVSKPVARDFPDIDRGIRLNGYGSLQEFIDRKTNPQTIWEKDPDFPDENATITVAGFLHDPGYRADYKEMTYDAFKALYNSVESLYKNGVNEGKFLRQGDAMDLRNLINNTIARLKEVFGQKPERLAAGGNRDNILKTYLASLIQVESIWNRLARGDVDDFIVKTFSTPTMEAGNLRDRLEREYSRRYNDIGKVDNLRKKVDNPLFFEPRERFQDAGPTPMEMTMKNVLAVLQNVGNYSNFDKLGRGYDIYGRDEKGKAISSEHLDEIKTSGYEMNMQDPIMNWLFKNTTKEDWDRAQKLGDIFAALFEHSEQVYTDLGAMPGAKIPLKGIETPWGTYKGWYHPVVYDPLRPGVQTVRDPLEEGSYYRVATPAGYQMTRTGYAAPMLLDFEAIPYRMKQIINDIAMRPVVSQLAKVFYDSDFKTAMSRYYGKEFEKLLIPYLRDIAGQARYRDAVQSAGVYWAEKAYQNIVGTMIGFNLGTVAKHFMTALMNSAKEVGPGSFLKEFGHMWMTPEGWKDFDWIMNGGHVEGLPEGEWTGSNELQRRSRNWYETLGGTHYELWRMNDGTIGSFFERWRQFAIKAGATPVAISDLMSAAAMWKTAYRQAIDAGELHGTAVSKADKAVRYAHGSTAITARPAIMRGGPVARMMVPFYTFFNEMLQRQYEMMWRARDGMKAVREGDYQTGKRELAKAGFNLWTYVIFPTIVEQAFSPIVFGQQDSELKKLGAVLGRDISSSFPVIRDIVDFMLSGHDASVGVYNEGFHAIQDVWRDIEKGNVALNKAHAGRTFKHFATALGTFTGLMNAQEGRWGQFAIDKNNRIAYPHGAGDWYRAIRTGNPRAKLPTPAAALGQLIP